MTQDKLIEGNMMIAEFMGLIREDPSERFRLHQWYRPDKDRRKKSCFVGYDHSLEYHSSWDWIMTVVEKIENTDDTSVEFKGNLCLISFKEDGRWTGRILKGKGDTRPRSQSFKIEAVWQAITEFIQWYKLNKK